MFILFSSLDNFCPRKVKSFPPKSNILCYRHYFFQKFEGFLNIFRSCRKKFTAYATKTKKVKYNQTLLIDLRGLDTFKAVPDSAFFLILLNYAIICCCCYEFATVEEVICKEQVRIIPYTWAFLPLSPWPLRRSGCHGLPRMPSRFPL